MNFNQLNLIQPILRALKDAGYEQATDIQSNAIPVILKGKDILGCAQTGTGKTGAFAIPILQMIQNNPTTDKVQALILTPTRELALQIEESCRTYSKYLKIKSLAIFGGVSQVGQLTKLRQGVQVLIATPGRLLDLMNQGLIDLRSIKTLVLDEADKMLEMGFINDVKKVVANVPAQRQTLFFSATMPDAIKKFAMPMLIQPTEVTVTPVSSTVDRIDQVVYFVEKSDKANVLTHLLKDTSIPRSLVFTRTKYGADKLVKRLKREGIGAAAIHGNKSQQARQIALSDFKKSKIRVLVATDIASRGIDIDDLPHVVNYELPNIPETYVHRIGRTGRAGKSGIAISLCDQDEKKELKEIQKLIGFQVPVKKLAMAN